MAARPLGRGSLRFRRPSRPVPLLRAVHRSTGSLFSMANRPPALSLPFLCFVILSSTIVPLFLAYDPRINQGPCEFVKEVKDVIDLPEHKYMIMEDCLYYYLREQSMLDGGSNGLQGAMPQLNGDTLTVNISSVGLRNIHMNEMMKTASVYGYASVSWKDNRLAWNLTQWKTPSLRIKYSHDIWVPSFTSNLAGTATYTSDQLRMLTTSNKGVVSGTMELSVTAECEVNFKDYPHDEHTCCFTIEDKNFDSKLKLDLTAPGIETERSFRANGWNMRNTNMKVKKRTDGYSGEVLEVCVLMERIGGTLAVEIWVPIIISAIVLITAPFFGALRMQLYVKMFSLLLQFLCFQLLVKRTPQIGVGLDEAPKVYRFYDLTIIISAIGLLTTLVLHALTNRERRFPPQHDLCLAAKTVNNRFLCFMSDKSEDLFGDDVKGEWFHVFVALNAILSLLILSMYILGCLLIAVA